MKQNKSRPELTAERLRSQVNYDPETGVMFWAVPWHGRTMGKPLGYINQGYLKTQIDGKHYFNHRLAWLFVYGVFPSGVIDHIDGNPLNNKISNLRDVPQRLNRHNQRRPSKANKFGLIGVSPTNRKKKFRASIETNGKSIWLGRHETAELAHDAYLKAKRVLHEGMIE